MSDKQYVSRDPSVAARQLGDEMMILSPASSTFYALDEVATVIWNAADGVATLEEIVAGKICAKYDVTPEAALKDARAFVERLAEHGILHLSDQPIAEAPGSRTEQP